MHCQAARYVLPFEKVCSDPMDTLPFLVTLFLILLSMPVSAQQKVFDVHVHGSKDVQAQLDALNDAGVYKMAISTSWDLQQQYASRGDLKIIRGLMFPCPNGKVPYGSQLCFGNGSEYPPLQWVEDEIKAGNIQFLGEVLSQYYGIGSSDSTLLPYYRLASTYNIPVGIHTGSAGPDHGCPNFSEAMGNPKLMETLLTELPGLRVWIMHAGTPYHREAIDIMNRFPNVYADISAINNPRIIPPAMFGNIIKLFVDNGLEDRLMFGSDNADIHEMIQSITGLSFLSEEQREKILYRNAERFFEGLD